MIRLFGNMESVRSNDCSRHSTGNYRNHINASARCCSSALFTVKDRYAFKKCVLLPIELVAPLYVDSSELYQKKGVCEAGFVRTSQNQTCQLEARDRVEIDPEAVVNYIDGSTHTPPGEPNRN